MQAIAKRGSTALVVRSEKPIEWTHTNEADASLALRIVVAEFKLPPDSFFILVEKPHHADPNRVHIKRLRLWAYPNEDFVKVSFPIRP